MSARFVNTRFHLPPGPLATARAREALDVLWKHAALLPPFQHGHFGVLGPTPIDDPVTAIVEHLAAHGNVMVFGSSGEEGAWISISPNSARRNTRGAVAWHVPIDVARSDSWLELHRELMVRVSKILECPYAVASTELDNTAKTRRFITSEHATTEVSRVRGYHEGLVGLFWRNVFGPLFTDMIGDRLRTLPADVAEDLGDGYWFVQPYDRPELAGTEEGKRRETALIDAIGRDLFYDMAREQPAAHVPPLPWPLDPEELAPREDIPAQQAPSKEPATTARSDNRYWLLYASSSGFSVDKAADLLRTQSGFSLERKPDGFAVRHGKGPVLHLRAADHSSAVAEIAKRIDVDQQQAEQLASTNACIEVEFDDLGEVLDEANTLIESQLQLQDATHGVPFMLWNDTLQKWEE